LLVEDDKQIGYQRQENTNDKKELRITTTKDRKAQKEQVSKKKNLRLPNRKSNYRRTNWDKTGSTHLYILKY